MITPHILCCSKYCNTLHIQFLYNWPSLPGVTSDEGQFPQIRTVGITAAVFTGWMPFLSPNQLSQSTEEITKD